MLRKTLRRCSSLEVLETRTLLAADVMFAEPVTYEAGNAAGVVHAWDVNGDHMLDLVVGNWNCCGDNGDVRVLLGKGDGTFHDAQQFSPGSGSSMAGADFDGDGDLDLVVNADDGQVLLNEGNSEDQWNGYSRLENSSKGSQEVASGDFDRDGTPDLVKQFQGAAWVGLNNNVSDGPWLGFAEAEWIRNATPNIGFAVTVGDVNNDGNLDLVVGGYDPDADRGEISVLLGNGDGTFEKPATQQLGDFIPGSRLG